MKASPPALAIKHPDWIAAWGIEALFDVVEQNGGQARVVGGAVRDALRGQAVHDIDMAVTLPPDQVMKAFEKAGLKVVPTGIDYGTVTIVRDHKPYQLTTLRRDRETDGRHAKVVYTDDWQADAARRDFTFNALSLDRQGQVYDFFDGLADLKAGCVRFIGNPEERIREDVLRILRAYRFAAQLDAVIEPDSRAACRALAGLLPSLSAQRVQAEIWRLLACADPAPVWQQMIEDGVINAMLPMATCVERLARLCQVEREGCDIKISSLRRLASLVEEGKAQEAARSLLLSNLDTERLISIEKVLPLTRSLADLEEERSALYEFGVVVVRDALLIAQAEGKNVAPEFYMQTCEWVRPVFPLQGQDILAMGIAAGPQVGHLLKQVEAWWRAQDFIPNKEDCLQKARALTAGGGV